MCCSPPTPVTLPFPLGSLPNPLLPRVTSLGPGTRCFIFNSPPLPLGELRERREGRPLGCSLLLCPSAQPVSLMLRLASLLGVSLFPACPPSLSWPVFCLAALASMPSVRVFHLLSALSAFSFYSFLLSSLFSALVLFSSPLFFPGLLPSLSSSALTLLSHCPCPVVASHPVAWASIRACPFRLRWGVGGRQWWLKYLSGGALGQKLFSPLSRCSLEGYGRGPETGACSRPGPCRAVRPFPSVPGFSRPLDTMESWISENSPSSCFIFFTCQQ